ncbi:MAG TPA: MFS transporter [Acidimicrobiia bacterium]|nr:MFS transporter [Acidimicrobiia bacterium]
MSALAAVLLVGLVDESAWFLPFGALESFRADLDLSYRQAGTVLALVAPGELVGGVFSAAADRYSRRVIAAGGAFGFAASLAMFALGGSFWPLALAAFLMGIASTAMVEAAQVALVDLAGEDLRPFLARSNLLGVIGGLLGPALLGVVAALGLSWRAAFWAASALLCGYGVALAGVPLPSPAPAPTEGDPDAPRSTLVAVVRDPAVWVVGFMGLVLGVFDEPLNGFTIALLEQDRGASTSVAALVAMVGVSGGLLSYTVLARRLETVAEHRLLVGSAVAMAVGAVMVALVPILVVVALASFVIAVGLNLAWLAVQHRSLTLRPGQVGTTSAVLGAIETCGFWVPSAIGAVADRVGLASAVGAFAVLGAVLAVLALAEGSGSAPLRTRHRSSSDHRSPSP